jgi:hypothetical protein
MNYPTPPEKFKKKSAAGGSDEDTNKLGLEKYGGYLAPLAVPMNFFCTPDTPPISKIELARMDPATVAQPGPPPELAEIAGLGVGAAPVAVAVAVIGTKRKRTTCNGPSSLKRNYTWKGGVAPKHRIGHVKMEDNGEANDEEEIEGNGSS